MNSKWHTDGHDVRDSDDAWVASCATPEIAEICAIVPELAEHIEDMEWVYSLAWGVDCCPICDAVYCELHEQDCKLKGWLDKIKAAKEAAK